MTSQQTNETKPKYKDLLCEERDQLLARLEELGVGGDGLSYDSNFADSSQVTAERGEVDRLALELQEALNLVDSALNKLENGGFGKCEDCGGNISEPRLEAKPSARFCMDCAAKSR